jgi:protein disulfide-isomerase A6
MPEFKKLMNSYNGNVKIVAIDSESEENKDLVKSQNIKGFPTIRYYPSGLSGDHQEYEGGRTHDDFMQYLNSL